MEEIKDMVWIIEEKENNMFFVVIIRNFGENKFYIRWFEKIFIVDNIFLICRLVYFVN